MRGRNGAYEEGADKGISNYNKLVPIKGGEGVQSQTGHTTSNCGELDALRSDPSDPVEIRHCLEDIVGKPEIDEHSGETVREPPHPGDRPAVDHLVGLSVEGAVEGDGRQVGRPDSPGWVDEEPTG